MNTDKFRKENLNKKIKYCLLNKEEVWNKDVEEDRVCIYGS
jgi:hypothetical protein